MEPTGEGKRKGTPMPPTRAPWAAAKGFRSREIRRNADAPADAHTLEDALKAIREEAETPSKGWQISGLSEKLTSMLEREGMPPGRAVEWAQGTLDASKRATERGADWSSIGTALAKIYSFFPGARAQMRLDIGKAFEDFFYFSNVVRWEAVAACLVVVHQAFRGLPHHSSLAKEHSLLLHKRILPLLAVEGTVEGVDPPRHLLEALSLPLIPVLREAAARERGFGATFVRKATSPPLWDPVSPMKQAALLRLVAQVVLGLPAHDRPEAAKLLASVIAKHALSSHFATAMAALRPLSALAPSLAKSASFEKTVTAVYGTGSQHWSEDVDRLRKEALASLEAASPTRFADALEGMTLFDATKNLKGSDDEARESKETRWGDKPVEQEEVAKMRSQLKGAAFQDFVFGAELGRGGFATVYHARLRERNRSQSEWPQFAVKCFEQNALSGIRSEVAALGGIVHPNIAHLLSAFRFHDNAYVVEEYAAGGDLHTLLASRGTLPLRCARFILGEAAAALRAVHNHGFAFCDFKLENVLLTTDGHVKLTDFGACRPLGSKGRQAIREGRWALRNLRDAHWRAVEKSKAGVHDDTCQQGSHSSHHLDWLVERGQDEESDEEDGSTELWEGDVIEGTLPYLSPELLRGESPSVQSDLFAFSIVLYLSMAGQHPLRPEARGGMPEQQECLEAANQLMRDEFFNEAKYPLGFAEDASDLCGKLLQPDPRARLQDVSAMLKHRFFQELPCHPDELYKHAPPPLPVEKPKEQGEMPFLSTRQHSKRLTARILPGCNQLLDVTKLQGDASAIVETEQEAGCPWFVSEGGDIHEASQESCRKESVAEPLLGPLLEEDEQEETVEQ